MDPHDPTAGEKHAEAGWSSSLHVKVPPLEVERLPSDIGAAVHLPQQLVVRAEVVDEGAAETQALHQRDHLGLQDAASVHPGSERLRDAKVLPQNDHVDLRKHVKNVRTSRRPVRGGHGCTTVSLDAPCRGSRPRLGACLYRPSPA